MSTKINVENYDTRGRKFTALLIAAFMLVFVVVLIAVLALMDKEVPMALGGVALALASCFPGYLGVNVYQKKLEAKKVEGGHE